MPKKCIVCQNKQPNFAKAGDKVAQHCAICKLDGMVDIKNPKCIVCQNKQPVFAKAGDKVAQHCAICKLDGMVDIKNPKCKSEWCNTLISNKTYEGYCAFCFMHIFPDKPMARNYKTKETAVVQFVREHFPYIDIVTDKQIQGGCSRRRPDIFIDLGYQIVIVEIDENQHTDYDCSCENKRIMELSQDVGHRPIVFIRFNPDDFKTNAGNVSSCWETNKQGICSIKKTKQKEWTERLESLYQTVNYWIENRTNKMIEVLQLFYDE
jgi:ribosomal protein S27E